MNLVASIDEFGNLRRFPSKKIKMRLVATIDEVGNVRRFSSKKNKANGSSNTDSI